MSNVRPKLLITHHVDGRLERGTENHITLRFENVGETPINAKLMSVSFLLPRSVHNFTKLIGPRQETITLPEIIILVVGDHAVRSFDVTPFEEGLAWLELVLRSNDGQDIECYQSERASPSLSQWRMGIYIRKPEEVKIIELLETMVRLLNRQQGLGGT